MLHGFGLLTVFFVTTSTIAQPRPPKEIFSPLIPQKIQKTYGALPYPVQFPSYTNRKPTDQGKWVFFKPDFWTAGFFPATLYEMHTRQTLCNGDAPGGRVDWLVLARSASSALVDLAGHNSQGHDVGFLSFPFIEELAIDPNNQTAIQVINTFAQDLAARFNPKVGATLSWDPKDGPTQFRVIIDNMMNLEVLFASEELTGNKTLREIAIKHADTTMKNHIRAVDASTWHVVEYNAETGDVVSKYTAQGYSADSTWSRGQAWAMYGFTNMYKRTRKPEYLETARRLATYFISNLPDDGVVPWDFNAPTQDPKVPGGVRPADSSAATIVANGLLLLSTLDDTNGEKWTESAIKILDNIAKLAWNEPWDSLLSNGTVSWRRNNYLTGIIYGDYYFVKAGNELVKMGLAHC